MALELTRRRIYPSIFNNKGLAPFLSKGQLNSIVFRKYSAISTPTPKADATPLRVAIVGSGPGGFYTAGRLFKNFPSGGVLVDMFEKIPIPHGLVRYGVAPDHPEVKLVINKFDEVASHKGFRFFGNVEVGTQLPVELLRSQYDAVVMAYGAAADKSLGVPGETLEGVLSARSFVNWYNGSPEQFGAIAPNLTSSDTAVIFGQGNVALDLARILLSPVDVLAKTDITSDSLEMLSKSTIKHVHIVGRRGPLQAAFTAKELREIFSLPDTKIHLDPSLLNYQLESNKEVIAKNRPLSRLMALLTKGYKENCAKFNDKPTKSCHFTFLRSPLEFCGDKTVQKVHLGVNTLEGQPPKAILTDAREWIDSGLVLRAIGYRSLPLANIPFDSSSGRVPNQFGRVLGEASEVSGLYVSGWLKTGPVGVIATTLMHAHETADIIYSDFKQGTLVPGRPGLSVKSFSDARLNPTSYIDWKRLEQHEFEAGARLNKPREKVIDVAEMIKIINS
ncbi:NADPH-adrenodoxin reductase [Entomophthora muscae]|uniref:NADPH-adrenodoxin reductase n=1 Tax=Entomophthora muscae TaxID=34485 RepID=A0ACC2RUB8_9FUNG|nr:NADPH-adrenodoxin reductase [Entomophthora muscae]